MAFTVSQAPSATPPGWPHCGHGATAADPVGCRGIHVREYTACLVHLDEPDRTAYLAALAPGADIDHRGTPFTEDLLDQLLDALRDPDTGFPHLGAAWFDEAVFNGDARFAGAAFTGAARFEGAAFAGTVRFDRAVFSGDAQFDEVVFTGDARFSKTVFASDAWFGRALFTGYAWFDEASFGSVSFLGVTFTGTAGFTRAAFSRAARFEGVTFNRAAAFGGTVFTGAAWFVGATFAEATKFPGAVFIGDARFDGARFETTPWLGPLVCGGTVKLDRAVFTAPVTMMIATRELSLQRTRWTSAATLRLRHAEVDLAGAVLEYPVTVAAEPAPFTGLPGPANGLQGLLSEEMPASGNASVRVRNLSGVDAAHLALTDVDLSHCRFAGAVHLDQLRVDGWCIFAQAPTGVRRDGLLPRWWSRRRTLAEEHHWRAHTGRRPARAEGWTAPPQDVAVLRPAAVAALYRQLRKSLEDGKNEPGAADFYYGEMEMRRHDTDDTSRAERALLTAYWAVSGYGLRAARALAWLLGAMAATLMALMVWGLPAEAPKPEFTGRQSGPHISLTADTPDPANPTGPWPERVSAERFEKALRVVINSVVFRSSGQDLTTAGTYTEMASRLAEPILLGLAVLAVRSRVKR
jgi:uncharacterized protein YjbI with pentapeptide repeats